MRHQTTTNVTSTSSQSCTSDRVEGKQPPSLVIDNDAWQEFMDACDAPEHVKEEFICTLWALICEFIEIGYGIHPLQSLSHMSGDDVLLSPAILDTCAPNPEDDKLSTYANSVDITSNASSVSGVEK